MNIMLANRTFYYPFHGGVENSLNYLSRQLVQMGHKVIVLCEKSQDGLKDVEDINGVKVIRHKKFFRFFYMREDLNYLTQLKRIVSDVFSREKIDVVWSRHLNYTYAALKAELPVVYYLPSFFPKETIEFAHGSTSLLKKIYFHIQSVPQYFMERYVVNQCRVIAVLSQNRKEELLRYYSPDSSKISVIQPGVDYDTFKADENNRINRSKLGLPPGKKIFLTVCRQEYRKNIHGLLDEFALLLNDGVGAVLVLVGDGREHDFFKRYAQQLNLNGSIMFAGFQKDTKPWYHAADIFVWPSLQEGFGQVLLEAMASGLPCIGYARGEPLPNVPNEEIIEDGKSGLIANYYVKGDLACKMKTLLRDEELSKRMSQNAVAAAAQRFSWRQTTEKLLTLSGKVVDGTP